MKKSAVKNNPSLSNPQSGYLIRDMLQSDNSSVANLIRQVSAEYGLTEDKGFSVADPSLESLYEVYNSNEHNEESHYWVIEQEAGIEGESKILGGAGIAPLQGESSICELQKMYFAPQLRGKGLGRAMVEKCFNKARELGFNQIYLETTNNLVEAIALYRSLGFEQVAEAMGNTGHCDCEMRMIKTL